MSRLRGLRAWLDESLFLTPPKRAAGARWEATLLTAAFLVLAVVMQLLRPGFSASLDSIWAEDGPIFLQGAMSEGLWEAVSSPYAGYLVLVPRLIGEAAALAPLKDAAEVISILSACVVAVSGLLVWHASAAHISSPWLRGVLAVLVVLCPVAGLESLDSASYVPWYMLFATFWLLLWRPATMAKATLAALFVFATALSTPGIWLFVPLAVLRTIAARSRRDLALVLTFWAGAAVQVGAALLNRQQAPDSIWSGDILGAYVQRVIDGALLGERISGIAWEQLGAPFVAMALIAACAGLAIGLRRSSPAGRWLAAIGVPTSLTMFVVSVYQRGAGPEIAWDVGSYNGFAGRYVMVPALLLAGVALTLIANPARRRLNQTLHAAGTAAAIVLLLGVVTSFDQRSESYRGTPPWSDALSSARADCVADRDQTVAVSTSPPPFGVQVPCEELTDP